MNPLPLIVIILGTVIFQVLLFGDTLTDAFTSLPFDASFSDCSFTPGVIPILSDVTAGVGYIGCLLATLLKFVANTFAFIGNVFKFLYFILTFNIPGAPFLVRFLIGGTYSFAIVWTIVILVRGTKA